MTAFSHDLFDAVESAESRLGPDRVAAIVRKLGGVDIDRLDRVQGRLIPNIIKALEVARLEDSDSKAPPKVAAQRARGRAAYRLTKEERRERVKARRLAASAARIAAQKEQVARLGLLDAATAAKRAGYALGTFARLRKQFGLKPVLRVGRARGRAPMYFLPSDVDRFKAAVARKRSAAP